MLRLIDTIKFIRFHLNGKWNSYILFHIFYIFQDLEKKYSLLEIIQLLFEVTF